MHKLNKFIIVLWLGFSLLIITYDFSLANTACQSIKESVIDFSLFSPSGDGTQDDSTRLQDAMDCLVEKARKSGSKSGVISIPPGKFRLDKRVALTSNKGTLDGIVIKGAGSGATVLQSNNDSGCIYINFSDYRTGTLEISDMRFEALKQHSGAAIKVAQPAKGNQHRRNLVVSNIEISHADGSENYFDYGIHAYGVWRPLINNVLMTGPFGPKAKNVYSTTTCFHLEESYSPAITNSYCWSAQTGVHMLSRAADTGPEGLTISNSKFVKTNIGINVDASTKEPEVFITNNHINSRVKGIVIKNRKFVFIDNNLMYNVDKTNSSYQDILITNSEKVSITNNIFQNASKKKHQNRTAIMLSSGTKDSRISGNMFNSEGTGIFIERDSFNNSLKDNIFFTTSTNIDDQDTSGNRTIKE